MIFKKDYRLFISIYFPIFIKNILDIYFCIIMNKPLTIIFLQIVTDI